MAGSRLVTKRTLLLALTLFLFGWAGQFPLFGQQTGDFSFQIEPDGTALFTQVLRWQAVPNVLYYGVTVQTSAGKGVVTSRATEPMLKLHLAPGDYRYRIALFNLLGKPGPVSSWISFTVKKAEIPRVTDVSQNMWFLDNLKPVLTLSGEELVPGAKIVLKPSSASARSLAGTVVARTGTTTLQVRFPEKDIATGIYTLVLTDPGGLSCTLPSAVTIRYQTAVDYLFSVGYDPWIALYDTWYTQTWPGTFFPIGADGRFSIYFLKRRFGFLGAELDFRGQHMSGGINSATVNISSAAAGVSALYKYQFSRVLAATTEVGGGAVLGQYSFHYGKVSGPALVSGDPYVTAGLSLQCFFKHWLYVEAGSDWIHVFMNGFSVGGLAPYLMSGVRF